MLEGACDAASCVSFSNDAGDEVLDFQVTERSPLSQQEYNRLIEREVE